MEDLIRDLRTRIFRHENRVQLSIAVVLNLRQFMNNKTVFDVTNLGRFPPEGDKKPFDSVQYAVDDSNRFCPGKRGSPVLF